MGRKIVIAVLIFLSLLIASCYPELSVQQYDQLKADLEALDVQRRDLVEEVIALSGQVEALQAQVANLIGDVKANKLHDLAALAYIDFLDKLVSTQTELILRGQFDIEALVEASEELMEEAAGLENSEIIYYLGLMTPDNQIATVGAYYKIIEETVKKIRTHLQ